VSDPLEKAEKYFHITAVISSGIVVVLTVFVTTIIAFPEIGESILKGLANICSDIMGATSNQPARISQ